jgi:hypothetical protein
MPRRHAFTVLAIAVALIVAGGVAALALHHGGADARKAQRTAKLDVGGKKTYAQLTAANYKILKPTQTARLLRYADAAYSCLSKRLGLGRPRPLGTKIVMTLPPGATPRAVAELGASCAMSIGDPPSDSSFQIRGHTVILYLPKYCILDKKIVALNRGVPDKGRPSGDRRSE